jgi:GntR family transcriptional regulator
MVNNYEPLATINKDSHIPIYRQIQVQLKRLILSGQLKPRDVLPSENELAQRYQISVMTVRQAMNALVNEGLIYRERGRGTFVARQPIVQPLQRLESFSEHIAARGLTPTAKVLTLENVPASHEVARALGLTPAEQALRIKRLRLTDGRPVGIHDSYLRGVQVERSGLEAVSSLYALLESQGLVLAEQEETLEAVAADSEASRLLNVALHSPLLQVSSTTFLESGQPLEFVIAIYRTDYYRYAVRLKR